MALRVLARGEAPPQLALALGEALRLPAGYRKR